MRRGKEGEIEIEIKRLIGKGGGYVLVSDS